MGYYEDGKEAKFLIIGLVVGLILAILLIFLMSHGYLPNLSSGICNSNIYY